LTRLRQAFLDHGYEHLTMSGLAPLCGLSRRALYHHFSNKEDAFRYVLRHDGDRAIRDAMEAGQRHLENGGGNVVAILAEVMDIRYGHNRRILAGSPHAVEINDRAFRLARDIMTEHAMAFQAQLAGLIVELSDRGMLMLRPDVGPTALAQMLCDGARGSNQTLPPIPTSDLPIRYRTILGAILYGTTKAA